MLLWIARPSLSSSMTDSFILQFYFRFTCVDVLSACMSVHCVWCLWRSERASDSVEPELQPSVAATWMLSIKPRRLWKSSQRSELLNHLSGPRESFLFPTCQTWKATTKPLPSPPQRIFPVARKTGSARAPVTHPALLVWFSRSSSGFHHLAQRCCVYCCVHPASMA